MIMRPLHDGTATARLLRSVRVLTLVNLVALVSVGVRRVRRVPPYSRSRTTGSRSTYLTPYRRNHKVSCVVAVVYEPLNGVTVSKDS